MRARSAPALHGGARQSGRARIGPGEAALGERIERDESDPGAGADVDQGVGRAVPEIIAVLDRDDLRHLSRPRQLGRRDVRHADVTNLALALKVDEGADRILDRHAVIDGMKLVEFDPLKAQPPQTLGASATQMFGPAVDVPIARARARQPAFAGDDQPRRVRVQGLGDQRLADPRPVGIGGVDKGHPLAGDLAKQRDRFASRRVEVPRRRGP